MHMVQLQPYEKTNFELLQLTGPYCALRMRNMPEKTLGDREIHPLISTVASLERVVYNEAEL